MKGKRVPSFIGSICLALILAALLLPACAAEEAPTPAPTPTPTPTPPPTPTPTPTPTPIPTPTPTKFEWPRSLAFGTDGVGSTCNTEMSAIAPVMEKTTGMRVRILPDENQARVTYNLIKDQFDFQAGAVSDTTIFHRGQAQGLVFEKGRVSLVWQLCDPPYAFYTTPGSGLETIYDIKTKPGVRLSFMEPSPAVTLCMKEALPGFLGWTPEEAEQHVTYVPLGSWGAHIKAPVDGAADVTYFSCAAASAYELEAYPGGIHILDMPLDDAAGWKGFLSLRPGTSPTKIGYGIETSLGHIGFAAPKVLMARTGEDEELVYQMAKWIHENYDAYKDAHVTASRMKIDVFREFLDFNALPVHAGAVRYLKEVGMWTADDDIWNAQAHKDLQLYVDAWKIASAEAEAKGIEIAMDNQEWIDLWQSHTEGYPTFMSRVD